MGTGHGWSSECQSRRGPNQLIVSSWMAAHSCGAFQLRRVPVRTFTAFLCAWLAAFSVPVSAERGTYRPPRHADGRPNFEGVWVNTNATPLVRPPVTRSCSFQRRRRVSLIVAFCRQAEEACRGRSHPRRPVSLPPT